MSDSPGAQSDQSTLIQIITWFLFVVAIFGVCARLGTKYVTTRTLGRDDLFITLAQVSLLAQCIAVSTATSQGLGKAWDTLPDSSINGILKAEYASTPLFILTLALIKWSLSVFIRALTPDDLHNRIDLGLRLTVAVWASTSIIISLFQCQLPTPWRYVDSERCINRRAWWTYVATLNAATECFTVVLYIMIFYTIRVAWTRKALVLSVFSTRLLVAAVIVVQLIFFRRKDQASDNTPIPTILNQAVLALSVVTACIPYLRPFMESLEADVVHVADSRIPDEEDSHQDRRRSDRHLLKNISGSTGNCADSHNSISKRKGSAASSAWPLPSPTCLPPT
ncbi:hypothetical protein F5Y13DRAFT_199481 [Hypoxylon sp. FL1857]|nr:hypothetical protein F5Y13DRAFT_199481 [Hypoxylon sp. FL1857]